MEVGDGLVVEMAGLQDGQRVVVVEGLVVVDGVVGVTVGAAVFVLRWNRLGDLNMMK